MPQKKKKIKNSIISLFTGAFGLDLGLEKAGFSVKACVEKDPACHKTILANRPQLKNKIFNDINEISAKKLLKNAKLKRGAVALVAGGPPCQPFSTVGRRSSISSDEGKLFNKFLEIVWGIYPKYFIFENVKGILSAAIQHKPLNMRNKKNKKLTNKEKLGSGWDFINKQFSRKLRKGRKGGYYLDIWELNAADYGVSQNRRRVFIIGTRDGMTLPKKPKEKYKYKPKTLRDAIGHLNGKNEIPKVDYYPYDRVRSKIFSENLVKAGQNWKVLPIKLQKKVMGKGWYATGGKVGFCRRLSWDLPSPTITTSPVGRATNLCHPVKPRPLNYTECALIQSFPKNWKFLGSLSQQYRQIGNAVPVQLAAVIGKEIIKALEK